jgi:hypothetical protein
MLSKKIINFQNEFFKKKIVKENTFLGGNIQEYFILDMKYSNFINETSFVLH